VPEVRRTPATEIKIVGAWTTLRDVYHLFLRAQWTVPLVAIVVIYLALNAVFAAAFCLIGGIANARPRANCSRSSYSPPSTPR
jgi:hypothetical protein